MAATCGVANDPSHLKAVFCALTRDLPPTLKLIGALEREPGLVEGSDGDGIRIRWCGLDALVSGPEFVLPSIVGVVCDFLIGRLLSLDIQCF